MRFLVTFNVVDLNKGHKLVRRNNIKETLLINSNVLSNRRN